MSHWWTAAWTVFRKELVDALRDRRTLLTVLLSSVAIGPVMVVALSALVSQMEDRAEAREVVVAGLQHAPSLRNYLMRSTYVIKEAPPDYEQRLARKQLSDAVLVVSPGFEAELLAGEKPVVLLVSDSANERAQGTVGRLSGLLAGFNREQASLRLVLRGVAPAVLEAVQVDERDLADPQARAARITGMVPFFVLMAVLYGALNAALDTTAGERERGSLEPLLATPATHASLVLGKWGAVASVGMLVAVVSSFSFIPAQGLLRSETLAAMFRYGPREALLFLALLLPLAALMSALLMAVAIRCKTFKEAQASSTVVLLVASLLPLVQIFGQQGEQRWHLWTPALAQITLMGRVLKGEQFGAADLLLPLAVALACAAPCLAYVARRLRSAAMG